MYANFYLTSQVEEELERWGLKFSDRMVEFNGHVIPSEQIQFGEGKMVTPSQNYDWSRTLKGITIQTQVAT